MPSPGARVPTIPEGTRRMVLCVPDSVEWLSLVTGCLAQLKFGWYWNKSSGDWVAARDRAQQMYFEFQDQNGLCDVIDCDEVADCIENAESVQDALNAFIAAYNKDHGIPGQNMPSDAQNEDMGGIWNGTCGPDITWSQSVAMVSRANDAITDLLQSISEASTVAQAAGILASLPVIENVGLPTLTNLAQLLVTLPLAAYQDDYTTEWRETLECEIFCNAKSDCIINFIDVWSILRPRVEDLVPELIPPPIIFDLAAWSNVIAGQVAALSAINKADLLFYFLFGGLAYGNVILNQNDIGAGILKIALMLAADEPSNDWEVLCEECPPEGVPEIGFNAVSGCSGPIGGEDLVFDPDTHATTVTGTLSAVPDVRATIQRQGGGVFSIDNITANVTPAASAWTLENGTCGFTFSGYPPTGVSLIDFVCAIQDTGTPLLLSFDFFAT